ncbi:hypothetical protein Oweho_2492 [Owenweeksia hongkongensis DSM 17368]|uniref:Uncharacterized protein n=1 Tax=Owenweeksia hongkongensis (strain DSM 17368 / CIP 108786 / JCM 12287 / NRRL B-23963 / UST20020801) TaxID=926562 RepID=G8R7T1_OWEHD|nr:hypothetical protein [Owenweeksia hongkongensis]AEV33462.1 hypothetical protein Oweho_2492 [Owenweeksia hongkongensis DSM 17368]
MTESKVKYTEEEILEIFKEQHRLCSPLDPEADLWAEITGEMTVREWRSANDLLGWKKLSEFLNQEFRVQISQEEWQNVLEPARTRKLSEVCRLLTEYAEKDTYEPKTLFGKPCIKAGVFLTIKKNLKDKGVDVSELRPSSSLTAYMDNYFSSVIEEITLTGTKPIDKIETRRKKRGFWNAINIFDSNRYETLTGDIKTFRDLTEKIIEEKNKN